MIAIQTDPLLISRFKVQVLGGSLAPAGGPAGAFELDNGHMPASIVTWTFAPEWLTPAHAAQLMGPAYSEASILALIEIGAIVAEEDAGAWLVEKRGLREYRDSLWEVLTYGD